MTMIEVAQAGGDAPSDSAGLVARYDGRVPRYTSYPTAPHFSPAVGPGVYARWLSELPRETPLSLYLHVPFCDRLCLYCGCNTSVVRLESSHRAYAALLMREIDHVARLIGRRAAVSHVHWGGGTPTSLPGDCLIAVMDRLKERFAFDKRRRGRDRARPDVVAARPARGARADGDHAHQSRRSGSGALRAARDRARCSPTRRRRPAPTRRGALGVGSLNLDLIYGLPLQTEEGVARTARRALDLKADRVAVFGYAHVPWMKRHQALIPEEQLPGPVARYDQLNAIHRVLTQEGGYVAVGLDHYALPRDAMAEAAAARRLRRSFQGYTTDAAPALVGFGASSIGSLPQGYVQNAPTAAAYAREIEADRLATVRGVALSADDRLRRDVIERVMCDLEVDLDAVAAEHRADPAPLKAAASDGNRAVRGGRPRVLGRAAHRGQRTRAPVRALGGRAVRRLSLPGERQAAPLARGVTVGRSVIGSELGLAGECLTRRRPPPTQDGLFWPETNRPQ